MLFSRRYLVTSFSVIVVASLLTGCSGPEPVKAPDKFSPFVLPDKTVAGIGPDTWKKHEAGVEGGMQSSVMFEQGSAQISITADLQGSLTADIARANNAQVDNVAGMLPEGMQSQLPKTVPAVEKLHAAAKGALEKKYTDYEEQPMKTLQTSLGEGRISEWTGTKQEGIGKYKVHGYRATILSNDRRVVAITRCADTDWKTLSPGFGKVVQSLANGGG